MKMTILAKIKRIFKRKRRTQKSMLLIDFFAVMFILLIIVYVVAWILDALYTLVPKLTEFRNFINSFIGMTLVVGFLSTYLHDGNNNGIPDMVEKNIEEGKISSVDANSPVTRVATKVTETAQTVIKNNSTRS